MKPEDKELLEKEGWTIECESPFEIRHNDGSFATQAAAYIVLDCLRAESPSVETTPQYSAAELLREEAERLGGVRSSKPLTADLRWAYSVAAAWLDCKNDPATIKKFKEVNE